VLGVLDLDPVLRKAGAVTAIAALGDNALELELAGLPKEVGLDRALFEPGAEDAFRLPRQQAGEIGLPHR
jgi:hypothetical protein